MAFGLKNGKQIAEPDPIELKRQRVSALTGMLNAIDAGIEGRRCALSQIRNPGDATDLERSAYARSKAAPFLAAASRRPDRTENEILDLRDEREEVVKELAMARKEHQAEKSVVNRAIADVLRPKQIAAAQKIARTLAQVEDAVAAAREVENEFRNTAPDPNSTLFVGTIGEFIHHAAIAAAWTKRMKAEGFL
jgi:hypothetical protein